MIDTTAERVEKYTGLVAVHEHAFGRDAFERADAASFDMSADFQRFRRSQTALTRELHQTIDQLMKLRKSGLWSEAPGPHYRPGTMTNEPIPARAKPRRRGLPVAEETAMEMALRLARMMTPAPGTCPPSAPSSMQTKPIPERVSESVEVAEEVCEAVLNATNEANGVPRGASEEGPGVATIEPNSAAVQIPAEEEVEAGEAGASVANEANPVISQISDGEEVAAVVTETVAANEPQSPVTPGPTVVGVEAPEDGSAARERTQRRGETRAPEWATGDRPGARVWGEARAGHPRDPSPDRTPG
jgi:hypothetical protein